MKLDGEVTAFVWDGPNIAFDLILTNGHAAPIERLDRSAVVLGVFGRDDLQNLYGTSHLTNTSTLMPRDAVLAPGERVVISISTKWADETATVEPDAVLDIGSHVQYMLGDNWYRRSTTWACLNQHGEPADGCTPTMGVSVWPVRE